MRTAGMETREGGEAGVRPARVLAEIALENNLLRLTGRFYRLIGQTPIERLTDPEVKKATIARAMEDLCAETDPDLYRAWYEKFGHRL